MVELKKELPEIFEEFAEQRKNSFLAIKEVKEKEIPVVGVFCTYLPREIPNAMGAAVVGLCSVSDETIPDAEKDLPRNLCPLIKSSYGFAKTDKCPFFYFSDLVVGETTCDGKKKMYEMLADFKPVHVVETFNGGLAQYKNGRWKSFQAAPGGLCRKGLSFKCATPKISIHHSHTAIWPAYGRLYKPMLSCSPEATISMAGRFFR